MADDGPQAKRSKQGPPVAAAMLRVESSVLGPASAGRRDPPESKPAAVSPPEIVRDVNVVSDPPSPAAEPPLELAKGGGVRVPRAAGPVRRPGINGTCRGC